MTPVNAYAAFDPVAPLAPYNVNRRDVGPHDVQIEILYCGVCHSDLHTAKNEWGRTTYPVVPGHEIVGRVMKVGNEVRKFKEGELAGVGCFIDSCRHCENCEAGEEQFCLNGMIGTYNSKERDGSVSYGGYSQQIVVDENYVLHISDKLPLEGVAPLLCAGITTYSPLRHVGVKPGDKVAVVGLGGLGHMAVKFADSFGAEVTMLSTNPSKEKDAQELGAHHFALTTDPATITRLQGSFNYIVDTVSATHDYNAYLSMLKANGVMIVLGIPPVPAQVPPMTLISKRRSIMGSLIGGIRETQEMLDYCAEHNITSDVEVIKMDYINEAYDRMLKGDVHYRFVIDTASLKK